MLSGLLTLVLCQFAGEVLVTWLGWPVPGPVAGMLLLFIGLLLRGLVAGHSVPVPLEQASSGLLRYLSLFFLPAGIGIFFLPDGFGGQWWPLALVIIPGTLLALLATALLLQALLRDRSR